MKQDKEVKLSVSTGTFVRFWLVILAFSAIAACLYIARQPLIMLAISFFLALVLNRPVSFIARYLPGKSRTFATFISYILIVAMIGTLLVTVVPIFAHQISSFIATLPEVLENFKNSSGWLTELLSKYNLTDQFNNFMAAAQQHIGSWTSSIGTSFVSMVSNTFNFFGNLFLVMIATFFMLIEGPSWEEKFWRLLYRSTERREHHKAVAKRMYDVISGYVTGQAVVGVISATFTAICVAVLSQIFHFDMMLIWPSWITIFLMVFVPMFGAVIGGAVVGLLLMVYSLPAAIIYVIVFTIEQQVENNIIQPRIQSKHMDMSALLILVAMTIGLNVGGILGALVAIPLAGCAVVLVRDLLGTRNKKAAADNGAGTDNDIDGILETGSRPVIFLEADRKFVGTDFAQVMEDNARKRRARRTKDK